MDIFSKMHSLDADLAGLVLYVSIVCVYVCVKTSIWWLLFGTLKLFRNQYSGNAWLKRTLIGLFCILLLALGNVLLWTLFSPENDYYRNICIVLLLLAYRITWREIFTLGGIDRGDWNFDKPNLRFFAWNTFNPFIIFIPIKWILSFLSNSGPSTEEDLSEWNQKLREHEQIERERKDRYGY